MKKIILIVFAILSFVLCMAQKPDNLYVDYGDRMIEMEKISLDGVDSVEFKLAQFTRYKKSGSTMIPLSKSYVKNATYTFDFNRAIVKPDNYATVNFNVESSQFCFQRSQESEHFICFWEKGLTKSSAGNITLSGQTVNVNTLLRNAEKIWDKYVNELGFIVPGSSTTDNYKILIFIVNQTDWRADGSGNTGKVWYMSSSIKKERSVKVGLFHCNPQAATARNGHTPAHEIAHTFQYLVSADLGMSHGLNYVLGENSQGNEWWEDCANWQAYKVYPEMQFSDGEYFEQYMNKHHLNIHHEDIRYTSCYYQDWWCQQHGMNTIGRIWREANAPEDPSQAYMRIFGLSEEDFARDMYECFAHFTSIDIDGVREYGKQKIGYESQRLMEPSASILNNNILKDSEMDASAENWWIVKPEYCVQNYGYNANPLKIPAAGTVVKAHFRGLANVPGYRSVNADRAGWRYGIAAYCTDGTRVYSEMGKEKDGEVTLTVPEGCKYMWFVVMGAPTKYWTHSWDNNSSNDEQWPYAVSFECTDPLGASRTYGTFPEDYQRKDTTVVIEAKLAQSNSGYSYVRVQYDMDAICQALGISTAQLKAIKRNDATSNPGDVRFAGVSKSGTLNFNTTTSTSSNICYGHWFTTAGNVCNYDSSAAVYAEMTPNDFGCNVGQYPARLTKGKTYVIRQAIVYTHTDNKQYKAVMEVHLNVN